MLPWFPLNEHLVLTLLFTVRNDLLESLCTIFILLLLLNEAADIIVFNVLFKSRDIDNCFEFNSDRVFLQLWPLYSSTNSIIFLLWRVPSISSLPRKDRPIKSDGSNPMGIMLPPSLDFMIWVILELVELGNRLTMGLMVGLHVGCLQNFLISEQYSDTSVSGFHTRYVA